MGNNLKRNLDKKKKEEYILQFQKQYNIDNNMLKGVCKLFKQNYSISGKERAINLWLLKSLELAKEDKDGNKQES